MSAQSDDSGRSKVVTILEQKMFLFRYLFVTDVAFPVDNDNSKMAIYDKSK